MLLLMTMTMMLSIFFDNQSSELFNGAAGRFGSGKDAVLGAEVPIVESVEMTAGQSARVQQLKERDQQFDEEIAAIGQSVLDLQDYAVAQNEEVKRQNVMLENLSSDIDGVYDHMTNVNSKMKNTLDRVGRRGDKFCVDIICLVLTVGFCAVFYSIYKETN